MNRKTLTHPLLLAVLWIACLFVQPVAGQPHDLAPAAPQPAPAAVAAAPAMRPSVSTADVDAFAAQLDLTKLGQLAVHAEGRLTEGLQLDRPGVSEFGWSQLARRLDELLGDIHQRSRN